MDNEDSDTSSDDLYIDLDNSPLSLVSYSGTGTPPFDMLNDLDDEYGLHSFIVEDDAMIEYFSDSDLTDDLDWTEHSPIINSDTLENLTDLGTPSLSSLMESETHSEYEEWPSDMEEDVVQDGAQAASQHSIETIELEPDEPEAKAEPDEIAEEKKAALNQSTLSDDEGQTCTICFEPWTTSSKHRLVSLKCGHLYGFHCIEKWLKGTGSKCPQCNHPAKRSDIRQIYARKLKAVDTSERDRALKQLETEKELRRKAEIENAKARMNLQLTRLENERLKKELIEAKELAASVKTNNRRYESSQINTLFNSDFKFHFEKSIEISKISGCRVLDNYDVLGMLVVSQQSSNSLFPGYGVKKICSFEFTTEQYIPIHTKAIKDVAFSPNDPNILTASLDKTVKLTNMTNNCLLQNFDMKADAWSCTWSKQSDHHIFVGLQSGAVMQYDLRFPNQNVLKLPTSGFTSPVIGTKFVSGLNQYGNSVSGVLVCQLSNCTFYEWKQAEFIAHPLPVEGKFTSLSYEPETNHFLISSRPTPKQPSVTHTLCEFTFDPPLFCKVVQTFSGGTTQLQMSRSKVFLNPSNNSNLLLCSGDETNQSALIWDAGAGRRIDSLQADSPILDVLPFQAQSCSFLSTLTSTHLKIYKWSRS